MYGNPTFDCDGAQIRAQCRQLATVVTITGDINGTNIERVSQYVRRFILAEKPFVFDMSGVNSFSSDSVSLLFAIDEDSHAAGVEWSLIAPDSVRRALPTFDGEPVFRTTESVSAALEHFADVIGARRRLLPLLSKTA